MNSSLGPILVVAGIALGLLGLLAWTGALGWFGRLPGDIRYVRGNTRVYFPIVSMLLVSLLLSAISYFVRRGR